MLIKIVKPIKLLLLFTMSMALTGISITATDYSTITTSYQGIYENFPNPERGFFVAVNPIPNTNDPGSPLQLYALKKIRSDNISLVRRYYLISEFRDKPISQSFLDMISNDCETARQAGIKLIMRFTYNWQGGGPDAPIDIVLSHIDQLKSIIQANYDVIAYMEAGFIGYWGEWHTSTNNLVDIGTSNVTEDARKIFFKILSLLPNERMVAIRYPRQKKQMFNNNNPLTSEEAFDGLERARTGHHNDGFRLNIDDGSTYSINQDPVIVEQEKAWVSLDTRYVVQGGEPGYASTPPEFDDCPGALTDFARMHWSAISINQPDPAAKPLYQGWIDQGCMEEIKRRLGYRFRLLDAEIPKMIKPAGTFSMNFRVVNGGWASPYNPRSLEVILRHRETGNEYYLPVPEEPHKWMPGVTRVVNIVGGIPVTMSPGEYQVLLNLPDPTPRLYNRPEYSIRLANQNVWEASTGYNSLWQSVIVDPNAGGEGYSGSQFFRSR